MLNLRKTPLTHETNATAFFPLPFHFTANSRHCSGHEHNVTGVCFDPSGDLVISASRDKTIRFFEIATGLCVRVLEVLLRERERESAGQAVQKAETIPLT